jgi:15-cis-phytoene desaturase
LVANDIDAHSHVSFLLFFSNSL